MLIYIKKMALPMPQVEWDMQVATSIARAVLYPEVRITSLNVHTYIRIYVHMYRQHSSKYRHLSLFCILGTDTSTTKESKYYTRTSYRTVLL